MGSTLTITWSMCCSAWESIRRVGWRNLRRAFGKTASLGIHFARHCIVFESGQGRRVVNGYDAGAHPGHTNPTPPAMAPSSTACHTPIPRSSPSATPKSPTAWSPLPCLKARFPPAWNPGRPLLPARPRRIRETRPRFAKIHNSRSLLSGDFREVSN
jgi:hypothetical protein